MSSNLPANLETLNSQELAALTGQKEERLGNQLPSLRVNYEDSDDDDNPLPRGQWSCFLSNGSRIFAKEVQLRIFLTKYQYNHYDADKQETVSTSVYFDKFGDEAPDTAGGFKCNKVPRKKLDELSEAEKATQRQIKCSRVCFGLLTAEGVNPRGEEISVEDEPVVFFARGTNFMPMADYIKSASATEGWLGGVVTNLSLKKEKNGSVTYWTVIPETQGTVSYGEEDFEILKSFYETVAAENKAVVEQHVDAQQKKAAEEYNGDAVPFDDDIPANLRTTLEAG